MSEWTKGPWRVFHSTDGTVILGVGETTGEAVAGPVAGLWRNGGERAANAALIAASPDLYAALEATLALVESEYQIDREERADGSHIASSVRSAWLQARAALARARARAETTPTPQEQKP